MTEDNSNLNWDENIYHPHVKGYKVFNPNWTGFNTEKSFEYSSPGFFVADLDEPVCCEGFHFFKEAKDCFDFYKFDPNNKVVEVIAMGEVWEKDKKYYTDKIDILREISWHDILDLVNPGLIRTGSENPGKIRKGSDNSGNNNSGRDNSGDNNSGHRNTGDCNSGSYNSGYYNAGKRNSGNNNIGNRNSGSNNIGNRNSGDWNIASDCTGLFNTEDQTLKFFDKETNITFKEWKNSKACYILEKLYYNPTDWIISKDMTDEEKAKHPEHEITGGYLKIIEYSYFCKLWWKDLNQEEKEIIKSIPNFDADKFFKITGIQV